MKKLHLSLSGDRREIWIGSGVAQNAGDRLFKKGEGKTGFILADSRLKVQATKLSHHLKKSGWKVDCFCVESTENLKSFESVFPIYEKLLRWGADRKTVIFALGGGVIGDVAGFIAGTYLRGIPWVGVPSTLLAQVDSSIGGKTAINHPVGKNLIGVFHQPTRVLCDLDFLKTLPDREMISGLGEMLKYGLIFDPKFYLFLKKNWKKTLEKDFSVLEKTITQCLAWKAKVVEQDEFDQNGTREVLNFGHTIGHALEAETGYGYFRHGEAVIYGMRAACYLSVLCGHLSQSVFEEIDQFLKSLPVPPIPQSILDQDLFDRLKWDKKARQGKVRFVLLKNLGQPTLDRSVQPGQIRKALEFLR
jgi:3-dehydroquinate synthase